MHIVNLDRIIVGSDIEFVFYEVPGVEQKI